MQEQIPRATNLESKRKTREGKPKQHKGDTIFSIQFCALAVTPWGIKIQLLNST